MAKRQIDRGTLFGTMTAISGVLAGLWLDGGNLAQILQPTAALIVLGGTAGAVMIQFPFETVRCAIVRLPEVFSTSDPSTSEHVEELVDYCSRVRRHGFLKLDPSLKDIENSFLRRSLTLAVDGSSPGALRDMMEIDLDLYTERESGIVRVLEAAGGFAPTMGIIGAILGLIQVMQRMNNIGEIGKGIAVAFVATLYGIGVANLFFIPVAGKLKNRFRARMVLRQMTLEAVLAIMQGATPRALRELLHSYLPEAQGNPQPAQAASEMVVS